MVMSSNRRPPLNEILALYQSQIAREGYTTVVGAAGGISIIDAGLIGYGANSFLSMTLQIYSGDDRRVDTADITGFDNGAGEIFVSGPMKGGQVPAGVAYKVLTQRPSIAEIHGVFVVSISAPVVAEPDTIEDLSISISTVDGIPPAANLTPGTITITRIRAGVEFVAVNGLACTAANGRIFYAYTFPNANWQDGDSYKAVFTGQAVVVGATIYALSDQRCKGVIADVAAIAALRPNIVCQATLDEHCAVDQGANKPFAQISIMNISGDADLVLIAEITTPPVIAIDRFRAGTDVNWQNIVPNTPMTPANGYVYYTYDFPAVSWANGDRVRASMQGGVVTIAGQPFQMPSEFRYAVVGLTVLIAAGVAISGTVVDAGATAVDFDTSLSEATNNHFNGLFCLSTSGVTAGQGHTVDVYTGGANGNLAFAASDQWTEAPANGSTFVLIPNPGAYLKKIFTAIAAGALEATSQLIKTATDKLAGEAPVEGTASANWNTAVGTSGEAGEDLVTIGTAATRHKVHSLLLDVLALTDGAHIHVKLFQKINGNERKVYDQAFTVPTTAAGETPPPDTLGLWIINGTLVIHDTLRVEVYSDTNENVAIGYTAILEAM